jgi:2-dehydropantoate 2-reductase
MTTEAQHQQEWPRIAVVGAGAVGCYFGGMLARAGAAVTLIARGAQAKALAIHGLFMDTLQFQQRVSVTVSTDPGAVRDASLVLFSVKTRDTREAATQIAPHLAAGATVLSLQNGVDNVAQMRESAGIAALPAVVYVAVSLPEPGCVKHVGRGDLVLGDPEPSAPRRAEVQRAAEMFVRAGVPCRVSDNIEGELWTKLVVNCAANAVSALARSSYGRAARNPEARTLILSVAEEAMAVARAAGIRLPDADLAAAALKLAETMAAATSSTAQDIANGHRTEIDALNGYIVRRGRELGVPTPMNFTLYALVKLLEEDAHPGK